MFTTKTPLDWKPSPAQARALVGHFSSVPSKKHQWLRPLACLSWLVAFWVSLFSLCSSYFSGLYPLAPIGFLVLTIANAAAITIHLAKRRRHLRLAALTSNTAYPALYRARLLAACCFVPGSCHQLFERPALSQDIPAATLLKIHPRFLLSEIFGSAVHETPPATLTPDRLERAFLTLLSADHETAFSLVTATQRLLVTPAATALVVGELLEALGSSPEQLALATSFIRPALDRLSFSPSPDDPRCKILGAITPGPGLDAAIAHIIASTRRLFLSVPTPAPALAPSLVPSPSPQR